MNGISREKYFEVHHQAFDNGRHLLRARAPSHEMVTYERWMLVTVRDIPIHIPGDGYASPTDFYGRAKFEER